MNDYEKTAALNLGRHARRTGIAIRRALRDYARNLSGSAARRAGAHVESLNRDLSSHRLNISSAQERLRQVLEDISNRRGRSMGFLDTASRNRAEGIASRRAAAMAEAPKGLSDAQAAADKASDLVKLVRSRAETAWNGLSGKLSRKSRGRLSKLLDDKMQQAEYAAREASRKKSGIEAADRGYKKLLSKGFDTEWNREKDKFDTLRDMLTRKYVAEEAAARSGIGDEITRTMGAITGLENKVRTATSTRDALRGARRAARLNTAIYGGSLVGGAGLGSVMALNGNKGGQEKKSSDESMRRLAEGLVLYMEEACRR